MSSAKNPTRIQVAASYGQEGIWFMEKLEAIGATHNIAWTETLRGPLDFKALDRSLQRILARHAALRTVFTEHDGRCQAEVISPIGFSLPLVDLSHLSAEESSVELERTCHREAQRRFDLGKAPLLRAVLFRLGPSEHVLLLVFHHMLTDAASGLLFRQELALNYRHLAGGQDPDLPPLPIQYHDYAQQQRLALSGERLERLLDYWGGIMHSSPATLNLPLDHPRPATQTFESDYVDFHLSGPLVSGLRQISKAEGVTLFVTLLAAYIVLLHRMSNQTDIVVGSPFTGRMAPETSPLIGYFVNMLPLRCNLAPLTHFRELLGSLHEAVMGALGRQDLPFQRLVEALAPDRNPAYPPLFQATIRVLHETNMDLSLPGLEQDFKEVPVNFLAHDLNLVLDVGAEGAGGRLDYNRALFTRLSACRIKDRFLRILEAIASDPGQKLADIPLLPDAEREQILYEWNDTRLDYSLDRPIHQVFETQVEASPAAIALEFEGQELTYRELNQRANRLARYLRKQGVGPDVLVAVYMERSIEMVVGLLGVLKSGGAYLPIDPDYPPARLAFILQDARVRLILTQARLLPLLDGHSARIICLDSEWQTIARQADLNLSLNTFPDNLAYVMYTSGSTGAPKGVMVTQRALSNHMRWMQTAYPFDPQDRVLQKTPFTFDGSVWEFFSPLLAGARLVMAQPAGHMDLTYLFETIIRDGITILQVVPSLLRLLIMDPRLATCSSLRRIFCGGEALPTSLAQRLRSVLDVELHNLYGPTETCINAATGSYTSLIDGPTVPIGRPIANARVYVLDESLNPAPVGVPGELFVGGIGLGRGYLNQPSLTAEKFIPAPDGFRGPLDVASPGERLYRTGDLVRLLHDGNIEFLGRIDQQVKLHGVRIELGEIEALLDEHPAVAQAVVSTWECEPDDQRLVAYVVPASPGELERQELRLFLRSRLPANMIPSAFVILAELPLTPNGKVDRGALPAPQFEQLGDAPGYTPPRSPLEGVLAGIWSQVLGLSQIGVFDNFFDLGGHSLLAIRITALARDALQVELPISLFFEHPTIAGAAQALAEISGDRQRLDEIADVVLDLADLSEAETKAILDGELSDN